MECNLVLNHTRDLKSQVWFMTKIARHKVQLPLHYSHFEVAEFSQYQYFINQGAGLLKKRKQKGFYISFCIPSRNDAKYNKNCVI